MIYNILRKNLLQINKIFSFLINVINKNKVSIMIVTAFFVFTLLKFNKLQYAIKLVLAIKIDPTSTWFYIYFLTCLFIISLPLINTRFEIKPIDFKDNLNDPIKNNTPQIFHNIFLSQYNYSFKESNKTYNLKTSNQFINKNYISKETTKDLAISVTVKNEIFDEIATKYLTWFREGTSVESLKNLLVLNFDQIKTGLILIKPVKHFSFLMYTLQALDIIKSEDVRIILDYQNLNHIDEKNLNRTVYNSHANDFGSKKNESSLPIKFIQKNKKYEPVFLSIKQIVEKHIK